MTSDARTSRERFGVHFVRVTVWTGLIGAAIAFAQFALSHDGFFVGRSLPDMVGPLLMPLIVGDLIGSLVGGCVVAAVLTWREHS
jgi:hypothetical protein